MTDISIPKAQKMIIGADIRAATQLLPERAGRLKERLDGLAGRDRIVNADEAQAIASALAEHRGGNTWFTITRDTVSHSLLQGLRMDAAAKSGEWDAPERRSNLSYRAALNLIRFRTRHKENAPRLMLESPESATAGGIQTELGRGLPVLLRERDGDASRYLVVERKTLAPDGTPRFTARDVVGKRTIELDSAALRDLELYPYDLDLVPIAPD